jgi:hypothetical protein
MSTTLMCSARLASRHPGWSGVGFLLVATCPCH